MLTNGVRIVTESIPYVRSVTAGFWLKVGSRNEEAHQLGMSHMIEHMMFKGTSRRTARQIAETIDATGGQLNAFTDKEHTCYYGKVPDEHLALLIDTLADMLQNSVFDPQEIDKEKGVILEEIRMYEDSPDELAHEALAENVLRPHPLGRCVLGTPASVQSFRQEDLLDYIAKHYVPSNLVISVVGNIQHDEVVALISQHFMSFTGSPPAKQPVPWPQGRGESIRTKDTEQTHICLGVPGLSRRDEDRYVLNVLDAALGGGMSSRLFQSLREEKGLVYSTYSYHSCYEDVGMVAVYAGTSPGNAVQVIELVKAECEEVAAKGLSWEELDRTKQQLKGSLLLGLENMATRMSRLAKAELYNEKFLTPEELVAKIDAVGPQDIRRVGERLFAHTPFSLAIVGPPRGPKATELGMIETAG
jgi:predicted Zn-dependent peptidase